MKASVRLALAIASIAVLLTIGGYFANQFAPSLSSSISQSLSIVILSIGIASSSIAVLSGRWLEERYRKQNEEKRVKSAFVSYLSKTYYEIVNIGILFDTISKVYGMLPPDLSDPAISSSYKEWALDPYLQTEARRLLLQAKPIETAYYRENVENHLLFMSPDLAFQASTVDTVIYVLNDYYRQLSNRINEELPFPKTELVQLPPRGYVIHVNLYTQRKAYHLQYEFAMKIRDHVFALKNAILYDKKELPNARPLLSYEEPIRVAFDEATKDFLKMLFPSQSSSSKTSSTAS